MPLRWTVLLALVAMWRPSTFAPGAQEPACDNNYPELLPFRITIESTSTPSSLVGDGRPYSHDRAACVDASDDPHGFLHLAHPNARYWRDCRITPNRQFSLDLRRPVPGGGGIDRGIIVDVRPHMQVFTRLDSAGHSVGLRGLAVGESTQARYIAIAATDHNLRLYFNPTYVTCPSWIRVYQGSTHGTVTRTSPTHWEIDLPEGSIGRLVEGPEAGPLVDRGLYYFRAHLLVDIL